MRKTSLKNGYLFQNFQNLSLGSKFSLYDRPITFFNSPFGSFLFPFKVVKIFSWMEFNKVLPRYITNKKLIREALKLNNYEASVYKLNVSLINLKNKGRTVLAMELFNLMKMHPLTKPNNSSYYIILSHLRNSKMYQMAESLIEEMTRIQFKFDSNLYEIVFQVFGDQSKLEEVKRYYLNAKAEGVVFDFYCLVALLNVYLNAKQIDELKAIVNDMKISKIFVSDLKCYEQIIYVMSKVGCMAEVQENLKEMQEKKIKISLNIVRYIIDMCGKFGTKEQLIECVELFKTFDISSQETDQLILIYNRIIQSFWLHGDAQSMLHYFKEMCSFLQPNSVTYSVLLNGFSKSGDWKNFQKFTLEALNLKEIQPNLLAVIIFGYGLMGSVDDLDSILPFSRKCNILLDHDCYHALIQAYLKKNQVLSAINILDEMKSSNAQWNKLTAVHFLWNLKLHHFPDLSYKLLNKLKNTIKHKNQFLQLEFHQLVEEIRQYQININIRK